MHVHALIYSLKEAERETHQISSFGTIRAESLDPNYRNLNSASSQILIYLREVQTRKQSLPKPCVS